MEEPDPARYLYRGVSEQKYDETGGGLRPKVTSPFEYVFKFDGSITFDGSWNFGTSVTNAVRRHELRQKGFPSSGVSTTPVFEQARFYATQGGTVKGFVLKIDRSLLPQYNITEYVVSEWIVSPSVPNDLEVILVASDFGTLPPDIVVEIIEVIAA